MARARADTKRRGGVHLTRLGGGLLEVAVLRGPPSAGNYPPPWRPAPPARPPYRKAGRTLPLKAALHDVAYRQYLVWRGERLEEHYRKLLGRLRRANPGAVVMTWTGDGGREGDFLHSPRALPNRPQPLIGLPITEWGRG